MTHLGEFMFCMGPPFCSQKSYDRMLTETYFERNCCHLGFNRYFVLFSCLSHHCDVSPKYQYEQFRQGTWQHTFFFLAVFLGLPLYINCCRVLPFLKMRLHVLKVVSVISLTVLEHTEYIWYHIKNPLPHFKIYLPSDVHMQK